MKREDFLKAFAEMSPEDQDAIRAEIVGKGASTASGAACAPGAMKQHMMEMMKKIQAGDNPMAMCQEMMGMCQEMMQKMSGKRSE